MNRWWGSSDDSSRQASERQKRAEERNQQSTRQTIDQLNLNPLSYNLHPSVESAYNASFKFHLKIHLFHSKLVYNVNLLIVSGVPDAELG